LNLAMYGMIGAGTVNIGGSNFPVLSLGLGQKFYLTRRISLRLDLRSLIFNGPDVLSVNLRNNTSEEPVENFDSTVFVSNVLSMGLAFLF